MFTVSFILSLLISFGYVIMQYGNLRDLVNLSNTLFVANLEATCVGTWDCTNKMCSVYTEKSHSKIGYVGVIPNIPRKSELKCTNNMWTWVETSRHYVISFVLIILSFICIVISNISMGAIVQYNNYNPNNILVVNDLSPDPHKRRRKILCYILIGMLRLPAIISLIVFSFYTKPYLLIDKVPFETMVYSIVNNVIFSLIYVIDYIKVTQCITQTMSDL